jgi:hypothetical protein
MDTTSTALRVAFVVAQAFVLASMLGKWHAGRHERAELHAADPALARHYRIAGSALLTSITAMIVALALVVTAATSSSGLGWTAAALGVVFLVTMGIYLRHATLYDRGRRAARHARWHGAEPAA